MMPSIDKTLIEKIDYGINLYKKIELYNLPWWIHIEGENTKDDIVYKVSLMNEEQEIVYVQNFYFCTHNMSSNYFINISKMMIAEYDIIRKENLAITAAAHNFECYEGDWLEEEID